MHGVATALVLLGLFSEVRTPKSGYECLHVKYKGTHYLAQKFERSRFTGRVTLTMRLNPSEETPEETARRIAATTQGNKYTLRPGRKIELSGFEVVTDSNKCSCVTSRRCVDK